MTSPRILIAYGSKRGGTAGLAEMIGATLADAGMTADVLPAGRVRDVGGYDAVILGGALYATRWHRDARRFARRHAHALTGRPVWLFSSGPLDSSANDKDIAPVPGAATAMARLGARGHITFGGRLAEDAQGFIAGKMAKNGRSGDWRNPDRVRAWAAKIAAELVASPA